MYKSPKKKKKKKTPLLTLQTCFDNSKKNFKKLRRKELPVLASNSQRLRIMVPPLPGGRAQTDDRGPVKPTRPFREAAWSQASALRPRTFTPSQFILRMRHFKEIIGGRRHYLLRKTFAAMLFTTANTHETCKRPVPSG